MNDTQRAHLLDALLAQRHTLARRWFKALRALEPTLHETWIDLLFVPWTERLLALLVNEPFDAPAAQSIGQSVAKWDEVWPRPEMLVRTQEVVAQYLGEVLSAEEVILLLPRLAQLYGELATGFFEYKVAAARMMIQSLPSLSHQLRAPLTPIIGLSRYMLKEGESPLTEEQKEYLSAIHHSGRLLMNLADEIMDFGKVEHGSIELEPTVFAVNETIEGLLEFVDPKKGFSIFYGRKFEIVYPQDLGELYADKHRVEKVLLCATKFLSSFTRDGGSIQLQVSRVEGEGHGQLVFAFKGLDPIDPTPPYVRFYHRNTDLRIAQRLTETMGGTLMIQEDSLPITALELRLPLLPPPP